MTPADRAGRARLLGWTAKPVERAPLAAREDVMPNEAAERHLVRLGPRFLTACADFAVRASRRPDESSFGR